MASRRIKQTGMRSPKAPAIACMIGMVFVMLLASWVEAGTHTEMVRVTGYSSDPDSTRIMVFQGGGGGQIGDDSITGAYPDSFAFTVDSGNNISIECYEKWWGSATWGLQWTRDISLRLVTATATIDYAQVADSVDSVLSRAHGYTSWAGAGTGTYTIDIFVGDTLGGTTTSVSGVTVDFRNWAIGWPPERSVATNENGIARIATDSDSLAILAVHNPFYVFPTSWDSITWSADYTDTILGYLNLPAAVAAPAYVVAYIDIMGSSVDSATGQAIPRDKIYTYLDLVAEGGTVLNDGSQAFIPKRERKKPNSDGRVYYVVPANSALTPVGSYYVLSFEAWDGQTMVEGILKRFTLDTLVDPINILDATEVAP